MPRQTTARVYSPEFKVAAVERIVAGERVQAVANELTIKRQLLYIWWSIYDREGAAGIQRFIDRNIHETIRGRMP